VRDDSEQEQTRAPEDAERAAYERAMAAEKRAKAEAERVAADALTEESRQEGLKQFGVIYGGLILIGLYMVQPFLVAPSLDASANISVVAFAVAIPLLAALILVNRQETFRGRRTTSIIVTVAQSIAQSAAVVGIVAGFWHITWVAVVTFLVAGIVGAGVHSAGWRVESPREQES
jgi:hypothetical protein